MPQIQTSIETDLAANHFMNSSVTLNTDSAHIDARTRTVTGTWLGGFTGGVSLIFYDTNDTAIGMSNDHTFGVDGIWIGRNDRTDGEAAEPLLQQLRKLA